MPPTGAAEGGVSPGGASLPPECWSAVGDQIRSLKTLQALVSTCRSFHDIFTPLLYRFWCLEPLNYSPREMGAMSISPPSGLRHTRDLEISIAEFNSVWFLENPFTNRVGLRYSASIIKLLRESMINIRSFRWVVPYFDSDWNAPQIITDPGLFEILKESKTIKHIELRVANTWLPSRYPATNCTMPLNGFRNLTSLELYHFFYDDKVRVLEDLASTLADSPHLQNFGLGMACNFNSDLNPEVIMVEDELDFLEKLCVEYGSRKSTSPLHLKSLKLGHGMFILKSRSIANSSPDNFLAKLVRTSGLKTLHIFNGLSAMDVDEDTDYLQVEWSFFECTSLHQLSVTTLRLDVRKWLNGVGRSVQELIVTQHYEKWDFDLENFNALELPHLSMLFTRENSLLEAKPDDESSDVASFGSQDSFGSQNELDFELSEHHTSLDPEAKSSLDIWTNATVLDRLHDGGSNLTRLYLDLRLENQWVQFSAHLSRMHSLNQLRIGSGLWRTYGWGTDQYPTKESSLWSGVETPKEIAYHYAKLMKQVCSSLQYVRIHDWSWEFIPVRKFAPSPLEWTLRELEFEEILCMEVMSFERFSDQQAGLPCQERPRSDKGAEE
ncbi:hypothetical protein N431DRAFT_396731 [Stipitochalara longipes BDJ]|nr:hypothetical protein N431DRAFT_396731 [Stipitochalara longipes BDJ]